MSNAAVNPAFASALRGISGYARRAANDAAMRLIKCRVKVVTDDMRETFVGLFPSTFDAAVAGMYRTGKPGCRVSVRSLPC
jgi:hypothetical protein